MFWPLIFQPAFASDFCDPQNIMESYTLQILQEYLSTSDCSNTIEKLSKVKSISIADKNIKNIAIFSVARKLEYLNLSGNQIEDISPLSSLQYLKWLDLSHNPIDTMRHLPSQSLQTFWCSNCNISSWDNDKPLAKLEQLSLRDNQLSTIEIENLPRIQTLILSNNQIQDPSPLESVNRIRVLDLSGNPIDEEKCPKTDPKALRMMCTSMFGKE